ncbi:MAG: penicillin-binding protein 1A [Rubrivivax sp.]
MPREPSASEKTPPRPAAKRPPASDPAPARRTLRGWLLRALIALFGLGLALVLAAVMTAGIALAVAYPNLPEIDSLTDYRPKQPMRVFSSDGVLLGEFGEERRIYTPIEQIPEIMRDAVLAIEDTNFYRHSGVDYRGVARAALAQFSEAKSQGASTITMQVARNFYLTTDKTFTRKLYEVLLAFKIESLLTKDQILEIYMNQIFLGNRAYGFAAASEVYFGKPLKDITIAEAAMLAGLPKAPSAYNPLANPRRAEIRQRYIIERMLATGAITENEHDAALRQKLSYRQPRRESASSDHVVEMARQLVFAQYGAETYSRGLHVHLTIDSRAQQAAVRALRRGLLDLEQRQFYRGPEAVVALPTAPAALDARVAEALADHPDFEELRAAVVLRAAPAKVEAMLRSGEKVVVTGEGLKPAASGLGAQAPAKIRIRRGAVVRVWQGDDGNWVLTQVPEVEGAFVAMDPGTGAIKALVGGFDQRGSQFNRVTQAWRQPGSSFKPFIYSAALERGFGPATVVNDAPLYFDADATGSDPWEPKNYDGKFDGPMTLRTALARSKNMVSIRVLQAIGPTYAQGWLTRFGFEAERHPPFLTMALGAGSVTPLQMASGYAVFANGGYRVEPMLVARVTDPRGRVLLERPVPVLDESLRVIDERNAWLTASMLQEVTRSGTAAKAQVRLQRSDLYGKTGTTNDSLDAWFVGFQPSLVAAVWIGHDTPRKLGSNETGGGLALPVWIDFMAGALRDVPVRELPMPGGLIRGAEDWVYDEFSRGRGVASVGLDDPVPAAPDPAERRSILDLFRR